MNKDSLWTLVLFLELWYSGRATTPFCRCKAAASNLTTPRMTNEQLWQAVLGELELSISKANFTTWFRGTYITARDGSGVVIAVPNSFAKAWLENKYHEHITKSIQRVTKDEIRSASYKIEMGAPREQVAPKTLPTEPLPETASEHPYGLNPRYSFDSFVVGKGNELARAAAMAVTEKPGLTYNPLFLYGGVGLGKTHLMQAVGNQLREVAPKLRIMYVTCEKFTNAFIQSVKKGEVNEFKQLYRTVDILLVDDIQFLAGKEGTQEEFFHTFNELHHNKKQIILSSDRPPKSIPALENRLISRFEWGLVADIGQPDLETRIAILRQKMEERGQALEADILQYLATHVQSNVRELEGALNRIIAYHELQNVAPTVASVKDILSSFNVQQKVRAITPKQLLQAVAEFYDISLDDLVGVSRKRELVVPRQISMYLLREEVRSSFPTIGHELGGRDHTTAMHAYTKITHEIETNEKVRQDIHLLRQRLYAPSINNLA